MVLCYVGNKLHRSYLNLSTRGIFSVCLPYVITLTEKQNNWFLVKTISAKQHCTVTGCPYGHVVGMKSRIVTSTRKNSPRTFLNWKSPLQSYSTWEKDIHPERNKEHKNGHLLCNQHVVTKKIFVLFVRFCVSSSLVGEFLTSLGSLSSMSLQRCMQSTASCCLSWARACIEMDTMSKVISVRCKS